jgi:hypothetical protein
MGPVCPVPEDAGVDALDAVVRRSIEASHHHAPWPTDWKGLSDPLLEAAGVKSNTAFMKGAAYVRVDVENGEARVTPSTTKAYRNAYAPLLDQVVRITSGAPGDLGRAVVQAIALCE